MIAVTRDLIIASAMVALLIAAFSGIVHRGEQCVSQPGATLFPDSVVTGHCRAADLSPHVGRAAVSFRVPQ